MSQNIFTDPFVSSPPVLTGGSVGNGTLTVDKLTHFTIDQDYTVVCTAVDPFTVFTIVGDKDGAIGVAVVGTPFIGQDLKIFLTIQQGPTLFDVGDTFNFSVTQGTDLNQSNIDSYDELPQKNFGPGVIATNAGNHNVRFSETAQLAFKNIQDLKFESKIAGALGNAISIEYIQFTPGIKATRTIQDIDYEAVNDGVAGNLINLTYVGGGTQGAEVVTVVGNDIEVEIESGVSEVNDIRSALAAEPLAVALITAGASGVGDETQVTQSQTFLTGGVDAIGDAGNEVVSVIVNAIQVILESGVSTADQVRAAVLGSGAATALIAPVISGVGSTVQTAPVAETNLEGGLENVGDPGNEIVVVSDNEIQITFVDGLSTSQQIKTAVEASVPADALVTVTLIGLGQAEQHTIKTLPFADITGGESFVLNSTNDVRTVAFYYTIDTVGAAPGSGDDVAIDLVTGDTDNDVAVKTAAAIDIQPEWVVPTPPLQTMTVTNATVGPGTDPVNTDVGSGSGQSANFVITKIQDGFIVGDEPESSPEARTFLSGGLGIGTYALNTKEITDAGAFFEGNAALLLNALTNQGDETTFGETLKKGLVGLDDDIGGNNSGPLVANAQKTINNLIQNHKAFIYTVDDEDLSWTADSLSFISDIVIHFPETNNKNSILLANSPITILDGEHLYVIVDRASTTSVAPVVATTVPNTPFGENVYRIVSRIGDSLIWFDNTLQEDGTAIKIGAGGGGGTPPPVTSSQTILNDSGPIDITSLLFDKILESGAKICFDIFRRTDSQNVQEQGVMFVSYNQETDLWSVSAPSSFDDAEVVFTVTAAGQVQYTSGDLTGTGYVGTIRITDIQRFTPTPQTILNASGPLDLTGLVFDDSLIKAAKMAFHLFRRTDTQDKEEMGEIFVSFNSETLSWRISAPSSFDDAEVTFTITAAGQVQYTSSNLAGGSHNGEFRSLAPIEFTI